MRKVREVLRLYHAAGMSIRAIARSVGVSPTTAGDYVRRAELQGLTWPLPESLDDAALGRRLLMSPAPPKEMPRPLPQWGEIHRELRRKGVTLTLLWHEYKATHPEGLQYSQFCERYRAFAATLDVVMRQEHRAGEKMFVDYAGQTVPVVDRETSEERQVAQGWRVEPGGRWLKWPVEHSTPGIDKILPAMLTDIVLEHRPSGRRIVIDTKFTSILKAGRHREETIRSGYLYQIYAYLRSQAGRGDPIADRAEGVLLHPAVGRNVDETAVIQGHAIRFATVDLAAESAAIRRQLLKVTAFPF